MNTHSQGPATYFDGVTSAQAAVAIALDDSAITITSPEGAQLARWDYAAIEHLPASGHRLRLGLAASPATARLEVRDPHFAGVVAERLAFGSQQEEASERRRRHRVVEWSIAAIAAVMLVGAAGIPALAQLLLPLIPRSAEVPIGEKTHESIKASFDEKGPFECGEEGPKERAGKEIFLRLVSRLEAAADLPIRVHPFVIRTRVINAVAFPGGYVHIHMGLINATQSPEELGGIIAHELGHVANRDTMRGMLQKTGVSFLVGIVLGDVTGRAGIIVGGYRVLQNRNSRAQEAAADAFGVRVLTRLGADPHRMADFFERMMTARGPGGQNMLLFRDHPTDAARVTAIRSAPAVANPTPLLTAHEWETLKLVCSRN
jgi:Zn-dependent protease with chaperone function